MSRRARLGQFAATADEAVLSWRPDANQIAFLVDWVGSEAYRSNPRLHTVACNRAGWVQVAAGHWPAVLDQVQTSLSRGDLFDVAQHCRTQGSWTPLLVAVYAWGYGANEKLAHARYLRVKDAETDLEAVLTEAMATLDELGSVAAYERLRGAVQRLGPAFFTKFLYFAAGDTTPSPRPLILDAKVAAACRSIARSALTAEGLDPSLVEDLIWWQWGKGAWTTHRYGVYLDLVTTLTAHLRIAAPGCWPPRPDALELALFDQNLLRSGVWGIPALH